MRQSYNLFIILALAVLMAGCVSFSSNAVLVQELPDEYKSQVLTSYGVELYKTELLKNNNYQEANRVKKVFEAALDFNPANATAKQYLLLIEDYRNKRFNAFVDQAQSLQKKTKRSSDETYTMLYAIEQAKGFDSGDKQVQELTKGTADIKKEYIANSMQEIVNLRDTAQKAKKDTDRETALIKAFTLAKRVTDVDPGNFDASRAYQELKVEIEKIIKSRLDQVKSLRSSQKFDQAVSMLSVAKDLNAKVGGTFSAQVRDEEYALYYAWARYHELRKEWPQAATRISKALSIKKTTEGQNLQKRVAAAQGIEIKNADFTAALSSIDTAIAQGNLVGAFELIITRLKTTTDQGEKSTLESRRKKIYDSLKTYYDRGVQAYREERFKDAIAALSVVVSIDPNYIDASDYLEKSKQKQALLDQYGGS